MIIISLLFALIMAVLNAYETVKNSDEQSRFEEFKP